MVVLWAVSRAARTVAPKVFLTAAKWAVVWVAPTAGSLVDERAVRLECSSVVRSAVSLAAWTVDMWDGPLVAYWAVLKGVHLAETLAVC